MRPQPGLVGGAICTGRGARQHRTLVPANIGLSIGKLALQFGDNCLPALSGLPWLCDLLARPTALCSPKWSQRGNFKRGRIRPEYGRIFRILRYIFRSVPEYPEHSGAEYASGPQPVTPHLLCTLTTHKPVGGGGGGGALSKLAIWERSRTERGGDLGIGGPMAPPDQSPTPKTCGFSGLN